MKRSVPVRAGVVGVSELLAAGEAGRAQAQGEGFDPFRIDRLLAIDERLTRQFARTLGMLAPLKAARLADADRAPSVAESVDA
jgi:hypothetical protein